MYMAVVYPNGLFTVRSAKCIVLHSAHCTQYTRVSHCHVRSNSCIAYTCGAKLLDRRMLRVVPNQCSGVLHCTALHVNCFGVI